MRYLIGIGNYTGYDDSVGLRIIEHIAAQNLEDGFQAIDLGGGGINLLFYLGEETEAAVIVDSARMGLALGDYRFFGPDEVASRKVLAGFSTHEGDLLKVLELARQTLEVIPPLLIMGIEPEVVKSEMGISPLLAARIPEYAAAAIERLLAMR